MMNDEDYAEEIMKESGFATNFVSTHKEQLEKLRAAAEDKKFAGKWYIIGDPGYSKKKQQYATTSFNENDMSPRIILYPAAADADSDIFKAIDLCKEFDMSISVRTGGHQYCGYSSTSPANMQLDVSEAYPQYDYDKTNNVLKCGVSFSLGDWANKNNKNGFYLPMGVCANVHLGGHVHTGGWGMVARSHGLLADHVLAFDIILASGKKEHIVRPEKGKTSGRNDEIYYGVLGGSKGGDLGIVTHWEFNPIRNEDHPNSACYMYAWLWSKEKMRNIVTLLQEYSKKCEDGTIPGDYEFMMTITGTGNIDFLTQFVKQALAGRKNNGLHGLEDFDPSELEKELGHVVPGIGKLIEEVVEDAEKEASTIVTHIEDEADDFIEEASEDIEKGLGPLNLFPAMIQMWLCYTNKDGEKVAFEPKWFEEFKTRVGAPLLGHERKHFPVSLGLLKYFIFYPKREMNYPFVKRNRVSMSLPNTYPDLYTERMYEIMGILGTRDRQHLVSQFQIYANGEVAKYGKLGITSYSWRDQAVSISHDSFYNDFFIGNGRKNAEAWQAENDEVFINQKHYAEQDMRMFAYTFGDRVLEDVWQYYYDSEEKWERLKKLKAELDPTGLFSADKFSL